MSPQLVGHDGRSCSSRRSPDRRPSRVHDGKAGPRVDRPGRSSRGDGRADHARDAASADRDLHDQLRLRVAALGGEPAGALAFSCHGRGRDMFGIADHDASTLAEQLAGAPSAGFFAAGEIGPVGGANFMHSFTATVALFAP